MKKLLLPIMILLATHLFGQAPLQPAWVKIITPANNFEGRGWSVHGAPGGSLYWSTNQPALSPFKSQLMYRLDTAGNEIWTTPGIYSRYQTNQSYIVREKNGIVYSAGRVCDCIDLNLRCCDLSLVAWSTATGDTLWSKRYDVYGEYEEGDGLVIEDSSIVLTGWTRNSDSTWFDVLLMETDLQGNVIWQNTWDEGLAKDERQDGHIHVDSTHIFCTGVSKANSTPSVPASGLGGAATLWKFDRNGNYVDHATWNGNSTSPIRVDDALGMTSDGTYIYATGYLSQVGRGGDWFIRKYDKNLNLIWQDSWGGLDGEAGRALALDPAGNIYAPVNTFSYGPSEDIALLKYTPGGQLASFRIWGDTLNEDVQDIYYHQGAVYLSGAAMVPPVNVLKPLLIKVDVSTLTGLEVNNYPGFVLEQNFPNPVVNHTHIRFSLPAGGQVDMELRDLSGKPVLVRRAQYYGPGEHQLALDLTHLPAGTYYYSLQMGDRKFTRTLSKVK